MAELSVSEKPYFYVSILQCNYTSQQFYMKKNGSGQFELNWPKQLKEFTGFPFPQYRVILDY